MKELTGLQVSLEALAEDQRIFQFTLECPSLHQSIKYFLLKANEIHPFTLNCGQPGCTLRAKIVNSTLFKTGPYPTP